MSDSSAYPFAGPESWDEPIIPGSMMKAGPQLVPVPQGKAEVAPSAFDGTKNSKVNHAGLNCVCNKQAAHDHLATTGAAGPFGVEPAQTGNKNNKMNGGKHG